MTVKRAIPGFGRNITGNLIPIPGTELAFKNSGRTLFLIYAPAGETTCYTMRGRGIRGGVAVADQQITINTPTEDIWAWIGGFEPEWFNDELGEITIHCSSLNGQLYAIET